MLYSTDDSRLNSLIVSRRNYVDNKRSRDTENM